MVALNHHVLPLVTERSRNVHNGTMAFEPSKVQRSPDLSVVILGLSTGNLSFASVTFCSSPRKQPGVSLPLTIFSPATLYSSLGSAPTRVSWEGIQIRASKRREPFWLSDPFGPAL